jgi:CHC2 zinc finger
MKLSQRHSANASSKLCAARPHDPREVKRSADFVGIVSGYTRLRRAGRQFVGLCPFHSERTPSFYIEPQQKLFRCFGCERGGDIFDFIMQIKRCGFCDAVRIVAGVASDSEPRSGECFGASEGGEAPSARGACVLPSPQSEHAAAIARLDATEARLRATRAANDADAKEFATACESRDGEVLAVQFIRHRITSPEVGGGQHGGG